MQRRSIITILVALLLLSTASTVVFAGQDNSLIGTLLREDTFHPDNSTDPGYNEWHYFNLVDEEQNLEIVTTFKLNSSIAQVMLGYDIGTNLPNPADNLVLDGCPIFLAEFSDETPDVRIVDSTVNLTREGYKVHVVGETMNLTDPKQVVFDALFKPCAQPHIPPLNVTSDTMLMNWLVASPKMRVDGTLVVGSDVYTFKNAKGYHDHNWGNWDWSEVGWDWGQVTQTSNGKNNDVGTYTISFGNVTDSMHTSSMRSVLNVWKNRKIVEEFNDDEIEITHYFNSLYPFNPAPYSTTINTAPGPENIEIVFTPAYFIPLPVGNPMSPDLIIWEGFGTYNVEGTIDGKHVCYEAKGFMEYAAASSYAA